MTDDPGSKTGIAIFVDADACPVKAEIYRVAERHALKVFVVTNTHIFVPREPWIQLVVVASGLDIADDWIAGRVGRGSIVVTSDVPLADRSIKAGAEVIGPSGRAFTPSSIGMQLATRNLLDQLRSAGEVTSGPRPFSARDRSDFLQSLDRTIMRLKRAGLTPLPHS